MKKIIYILGLLLCMNSVYAGFYFQDSSFPFGSMLRVCNSSECENLVVINESTKVSTITGINTVYEIESKYSKVDLWNTAISTPRMILFILVIGALILFFLSKLRRGKK